MIIRISLSLIWHFKGKCKGGGSKAEKNYIYKEKEIFIKASYIILNFSFKYSFPLDKICAKPSDDLPVYLKDFIYENIKSITDK